MQQVTTEQALRNAVASAEMEGFRFSKDEIENVRQSLAQNMSREEFLAALLAKQKGSVA